MENNDQRNKKFGFKKSKWSVLPVIFSGILAAGALGGAGVAVWQVAKNYTDGGEFTKTVKGRVEIDPLANFNESERQTKTKAEAEECLSECAERLSRWLKDQGQKSYDVSYELYDVEEVEKEGDDFPEGQRFAGYLSANFEVDKIKSKVIFSDEDKDEKIDNDPYLSYFDAKAFSTNEKTLVYRWYITNAEEKDEPQYSIIPFRDLFTIPEKVGVKSDKSKVLVDKDGNNGVVYKVDTNDILNRIFKDLAQAKKDSEEKDPENKEIKVWAQPRLYVVNNLNNLYNEVNYHLANWLVNNGKTEYRKIYENTSYANIAKQYYETTFTGDKKTDSEKALSFHLDNTDNHDEAGKSYLNADVFNYVDQKTAGTIDADWSFTNKYVTKVVTMNDYQQFMPDKITDDYTNDVDFEGDNVKINYFWYKLDTKDQAEKFLDNEITYGFKKSSITNFDFSNISESSAEAGANKVLTKLTGHKFKSIDVDPSFTKTIFGGSQLVGMLSMGFLAFLVALLIILALLYITTGVMSWICMMFALSMTLLIATIGSTAIGLSLIFGLFIEAIAAFIAALTICGRMKRRLKSNEDTQIIINKTFKKSLLPVVDISVVTLIFGICFTYIAPITLNPLGLVLIIGAFAIFISVFLLNGLLHGLFFNNRILVNRYRFFGKPSNIANEALTQSNMDIPTSLDATRLEFGYYSSMSRKKLDATNKKALIALIVIGILLIACVVAFTVLGWRSNTMFHTTSCLAICTDQDVIGQGWVDGLNYVSYRHDVASGWWYFYTNANNVMDIAKAIPLTFGKSVYVQDIIGSTNQDVLNFALISILVGAACCSVYGAIRFNWIALVPLLAGIFAIPMIILGLSAVAQVKFDQFVVIAFVFVVVVNTIFCLGLVGNINEAWSRKDAYNSTEFKYIVNIALTNSWTYIWNIALAYILFVVAFGLTAPEGLLSAIILLAIAILITILLAPITIAFLLYRFMLIRNKALTRLVAKNANKVVINYDEIDEQGIEGINKFTKRIPVSVEKPKGGK